MPAPGARIVEIAVEGAADPADAEAARGVFGLREGDEWDPGAVRLGVKRVYLTGTWADVRVYAEPTGGGVRLILRLSPDLVVGDVSIDARGRLPVARLRPVVGLTRGDRFRDKRVEDGRLALQAACAELGYPRAKVEARIEPAQTNAHAVRFVIDPGEPTRVRRVSLLGRPAMSRREVLQRLGVSEGKPFDRLRLEDGLERLTKRLVERRHLKASAEILNVEYDESARHVDLSLRVNAGPRYRVDHVGNAVVDDATLRPLFNVATVGALDETSVQRTARRLEEHYREQGFARVRVQTDEVPAYAPWDRDADVVLRFLIEEGPRVEVRDIIVEGGVAKDGRELAADLWGYVLSEMSDGGLFQRFDAGDLEETHGRRAGAPPEDRPVERPDVAFNLLPAPHVERHPPFTARLFDGARQRLIDRYRKEGFLKIVVEGPEAIWLDGGAAVRVRYRIDEGPQVRIAGVRFEPMPSLPLAELLSDATLEPGQPADLYAIEQTRLALESGLKERGFPFAQVSERFVQLPDPGIADVVYTIEEGPRVRIGEVRIRGNRTTQTFVIVDRVTLRDGDWYSASAVEQSRQRILRMGIFSSVSIGFLDDRPDAEVRDLLVEVRERQRYSLEMGVGVSVEDGPRAFSAFEMRNLWGFGVGLRGRAQLNYPRAFYDFVWSDEQDTSPGDNFFLDVDEPVKSLLFTEGQLLVTTEMPKVYGVPFDARLHLDVVGLREIRPAFALLKGSVLSGFDAQPTSWFRLEPQVEAETSDFECSSSGETKTCGEGSLGLTRRVDEGTLGQLTFRLLSSLDLRDDPFRPHAGFFGSLTTDVAVGVGVLRDSDVGAGDVESNFLRLAGVMSGYVPLADGVTLALTLRGGNIFGLPTSRPDIGNYVPLFKRFYLGGTGSVRGFVPDEILPVDDERWPAEQRDQEGGADAPRPTSLGGNFFVNARSSLRMGIIGDLELGLFVDTGQLANDVVNVQLAGFAMGLGFGVRYNTPVGPFAVDLGWKVIDAQRRLPQLGDVERLNLHLSIGYF
jgi:outer membrane protein assembly factor BamA